MGEGTTCIVKIPYFILFAPFYRGSNVSNISGTGLGLSIVKKCLDLHKGKINIHSQEGEGTICTVKLPFVPVD